MSATVYKRLPAPFGSGGFQEYAFTSEGELYSRYTSVTRNKTYTRPTKWQIEGAEFSLSLMGLYDPDNPPERIELKGSVYRRQRGVTFRLPRSEPPHK